MGLSGSMEDFMFFFQPLVHHKSASIFALQIQLPFLQRQRRTCVEKKGQKCQYYILANMSNMLEVLTESFDIVKKECKLQENVWLQI